MNTVFCHPNINELPEHSDTLVPVLLYGVSDRSIQASIGHAALASLKRFTVEPSVQAFDFLSIALAVTAADTFILREDAPDRWCRNLKIVVALHDPNPWRNVAGQLEAALRFLSGDTWSFEFLPGGLAPPTVNTRYSHLTISLPPSTDVVTLFSGGLDSTIGVLNLLEEGHTPLLVSHAYKGDARVQQNVLQHFPQNFVRFGANLHPAHIAGLRSDITMRTRSFNFLALATVAASVLSQLTHVGTTPIFVPENGFIALNPPLTPRRVGSLSTRTTHPYFLQFIQNIFNAVGIDAAIGNPYEFKTKGEMFAECKNPTALFNASAATMSCSNWKRKGMACGRCVPCLIRRASFHHADVTDFSSYVTALNNQITEIGDDLLAVQTAIMRANRYPNRTIASRSGPLPLDAQSRAEYEGVARRGLTEIQNFLMPLGLA